MAQLHYKIYTSEWIDCRSFSCYYRIFRRLPRCHLPVSGDITKFSEIYVIFGISALNLTEKYNPTPMLMTANTFLATRFIHDNPVPSCLAGAFLHARRIANCSTPSRPSCALLVAWRHSGHYVHTFLITRRPLITRILLAADSSYMKGTLSTLLLNLGVG